LLLYYEQLSAKTQANFSQISFFVISAATKQLCLYGRASRRGSRGNLAGKIILTDKASRSGRIQQLRHISRMTNQADEGGLAYLRQNQYHQPSRPWRNLKSCRRIQGDLLSAVSTTSHLTGCPA
jgi:hypothetical protein